MAGAEGVSDDASFCSGQLSDQLSQLPAPAAAPPLDLSNRYNGHSDARASAHAHVRERHGSSARHAQGDSNIGLRRRDRRGERPEAGQVQGCGRGKGGWEENDIMQDCDLRLHFSPLPQSKRCALIGPTGIWGRSTSATKAHDGG